jgi:hypothetical protein
MNFLQMRQSGCRPRRDQQRAGFAGKFARISEQPIDDQSVAHMPVQVVLGREADATEHLLTVASRGEPPGRLAPCQQGAEVVGGGLQGRLGTVGGMVM